MTSVLLVLPMLSPITGRVDHGVALITPSIARSIIPEVALAMAILATMDHARSLRRSRESSR